MDNMQKSKRSRTVIQILCTLSLFLLFAICSLLLISISASNYKGLLGDNNDNFNANTSLRYVSTKLHSYDMTNGINIETISGVKCISLTQSSENEIYNTLIYYHNGYLYELYASKDFDFQPGNGEKLMKVNNFSFDILNNNAIALHADNARSEKISTVVYLRCAKPEEVR